MKKYSHSAITKIIISIAVILCFTGAVTSLVNTAISNDGYFSMIFEDNYFLSRDYLRVRENISGDLIRLIGEFKNEEHILNSSIISLDEIQAEENNLFMSYVYNSRSYNPNLSHEENYEKFKEEHSDDITQIKDDLIKKYLREYNLLLQRLGKYKGVIYYASDGVNVITNTTKTDKEYFKSFPSYIILDKYDKTVYPRVIENVDHYYIVRASNYELDERNNVIYISFTNEFLNPKIKEWVENKAAVSDSLYKTLGFFLAFTLLFIYLAIIIGRESFKDKEVHLNSIDRFYNDIKLGLCLCLIFLWLVSLQAMGIYNLQKVIIPITALFTAFILVLVLSIIKHFKNRTFIKHLLIYSIFSKLFKFVKTVYESGSVGVKVVLIVIVYPILVALTFFIFPVTIGVAAWLAFKRVKEFNAIKEGVMRVKDGDIHHPITLSGNSEFAKLADNVNSIADGLKKAVANELKSERLKTELITNVSHDIRTPLTSIITYIDLLKKEKDQSKAEGYIEILDQKSQRLKMLTDDLFEASKASSGNIPVNPEQIDIVSLITQGLGELNDKIEALELKLRINHPKDKVYITADGKLLWRAIENLLSNIFKYALKGSRVYIDIEILANEVMLVIKNISAYELNISADELIERFKRGDESRNSQGSGLGLSIAKSLIDIQKGRFNIEIDGDLFKAIIYMPRYKNSND